MPGGRPTKYSQEMVDKSYEYIEKYNSEYGDMIPSIEGLADALDINRSTIYDWDEQEEKEEFSHMLDRLVSTQKKVLVNNGLSGDFNSNITKLVLTKHGFSDKQETTGSFNVSMPSEDAGTL